MKKKETKKRDPGKKSYRITIGEPEYSDVILTLESIPKAMRGVFIAESIRLAKKNLKPADTEGSSMAIPFSFKSNFDD